MHASSRTPVDSALGLCWLAGCGEAGQGPQPALCTAHPPPADPRRPAHLCCAALGACRALAQAGLTTPAGVCQAGQERVKTVLAGAGYDRYGEVQA